MMVFFLKYVHIYQYKERQTLEWIHSQTCPTQKNIQTFIVLMMKKLW